MRVHCALEASREGAGKRESKTEEQNTKKENFEPFDDDLLSTFLFSLKKLDLEKKSKTKKCSSSSSWPWAWSGRSTAPGR